MSNMLIEVKGISKTFKISGRSQGITAMITNMLKPKYIYKKAVNCIDFSIDEGEMVGFIGPNGAGKSTTIKMLSGILHPDSGDIKIAGYIPYKQRKKYVANIGVVFGQKTQLSWDLPLIESFELLKHIYKIPNEKYEENLNKFTKLLNMEEFINQPVRQLSLGQRMRGDIAAALLHSPKIVFFDEPTIGLDVVAKEKIRDFIKYLNKTERITMIFTTHDMQDIEKVCNRLIIIDKGEKIYDGGIEEIKNNYGTSRTIEVEFEDDLDLEPIDNVEIEAIEDENKFKKRFIFDTSKVNINNFMTKLISKYTIKDVSIKEPEIDGIIRDIYEGSINVQ
ncbi:ATP-binding cassette domain-containing protein [Clostridium sp.]|uniref:ABC transporter ATP-binding protein n=1 Tax=Clostridium sp. TaxID=1506 RepID=UPI00260D1644|nr:ATP-binding cassette domain-containing protein [Clostridium sp.]